MTRTSSQKSNKLGLPSDPDLFVTLHLGRLLWSIRLGLYYSCRGPTGTWTFKQMAPPPRPRFNISKERFPEYFGSLKTQTYHDPGSRGAGFHRYVSAISSCLTSFLMSTHSPFGGYVPACRIWVSRYKVPGIALGFFGSAIASRSPDRISPDRISPDNQHHGHHTPSQRAVAKRSCQFAYLVYF